MNGIIQVVIVFVPGGNQGFLKMLVMFLQDFRLQVVPQNEYGQFYSGDTYVVLHVSAARCTSRPTISAVPIQSRHNEWNVHFWLGADATTDEIGTAAIKAVEIDQALNGLPVQYREVQSHESPLFISYFPNGIRYAACRLPFRLETLLSHLNVQVFGEWLWLRISPRGGHVQKLEAEAVPLQRKEEHSLHGGAFPPEDWVPTASCQVFYSRWPSRRSRLTSAMCSCWIWAGTSTSGCRREVDVLSELRLLRDILELEERVNIHGCIFQGMARAKSMADVERMGQATVHILGESKYWKRIEKNYNLVWIDSIQTTSGTLTLSSGHISEDLAQWSRSKKERTTTRTTGRRQLIRWHCGGKCDEHKPYRLLTVLIELLAGCLMLQARWRSPKSLREKSNQAYSTLRYEK